MSSQAGRKIREIRESLGMGRHEFAEKTGIPKGTLIGIEQERQEPRSGVLESIAEKWPEYSAYLLTDNYNITQIKPKVVPDEET